MYNNNVMIMAATAVGNAQIDQCLNACPPLHFLAHDLHKLFNLLHCNFFICRMNIMIPTVVRNTEVAHTVSGSDCPLLLLSQSHFFHFSHSVTIISALKSFLIYVSYQKVLVISAHPKQGHLKHQDDITRVNRWRSNAKTELLALTPKG